MPVYELTPLGALSRQTFRGRTNAIVEIGKRMCQSDDEWKQKCAAMKELRTLLGEYAKKASVHANEEEEENSNSSSSVDESLFTPENIQALTQPFRTTVQCTKQRQQQCVAP